MIRAPRVPSRGRAVLFSFTHTTARGEAEIHVDNYTFLIIGGLFLSAYAAWNILLGALEQIDGVNEPNTKHRKPKEDNDGKQ